MNIRGNKMQASKQILISFLKQILEKESKQDVLLLNFTKPQILDISYPALTELKNESEFEEIKQKTFDIVIGDFPFGMQTIALDTVSKKKVRKNWSFILRTLRMLKEDGQAFFLVEPNLLLSLHGKKFLNDLFHESFFYNSVFELPEKLLYPETALQPVLIHLEKKKQKRLFIGEITSGFCYLLNNFYTRTTTNNLTTGIFVNHKDFESFKKFRIEKEIENLKTQYKDYKRYVLKEIAIEINTTRDKFQDKPNTIYIPLIGNSDVTSDINQASIKHQNLFQVVLKPNLVKAEFFAMFFRSKLGKKQILKSAKGSILPMISRDDILDCIVPIPSLTEQKLLIHTETKLSEMQSTIDQLKNELSINPKNANEILNTIHGQLKKMTDEDEILSLIRTGENKHIEFKETFSTDVQKQGTKADVLRKESLKAIVGFLNADGGTLLIGVADNGEVKGVENDNFTSPDKYKLLFKNILKEKIGLALFHFIDYELFIVNYKYILKVDCKAANEPYFLDKTEFYVRTNPATEKLEGKEQANYIKERFFK